jgi:hypothetical protein
VRLAAPAVSARPQRGFSDLLLVARVDAETSVRLVQFLDLEGGVELMLSQVTSRERATAKSSSPVSENVT